MDKKYTKEQVIAMIKFVLPERIDLAAKYEVEDEDAGLVIAVDHNSEKATGEQLTHLASYASDKGFNLCLDEINENIEKL